MEGIVTVRWTSMMTDDLSTALTWLGSSTPDLALNLPYMMHTAIPLVIKSTNTFIVVAGPRPPYRWQRRQHSNHQPPNHQDSSTTSARRSHIRIPFFCLLHFTIIQIDTHTKCWCWLTALHLFSRVLALRKYHPYSRCLLLFKERMNRERENGFCTPSKD